MLVDNTWQEVTLIVGSDTIIQNLTGLTLLVKFEDVQPTSDINAIYIGYRTGISNADLVYTNDRGKMWVRVWEELEVAETRTITVT